MTEKVLTPPFVKRPYGGGHSYTDSLGVPVPSVTSILSNGVAKPALVGWAAEVTASYAVDNWAALARQKPAARYKTLRNARYETSRSATLRGSALHAVAEAIAKGEPYNVPAASRPQAEAYARFLAQWNVEPLAIESVVGSIKHGYAGTFDLYGLVNGDPYLIDIKSNRTGVYPESALQLAAYKHTDWSPIPETMKRLGEAATAVVWLKPEDGGYELLPVVTGRSEFEAFLAAKTMTAWSKGSDGVIGEPLERVSAESSSAG